MKVPYQCIPGRLFQVTTYSTYQKFSNIYNTYIQMYTHSEILRKHFKLTHDYEETSNNTEAYKNGIIYSHRLLEGGS